MTAAPRKPMTFKVADEAPHLVAVGKPGEPKGRATLTPSTIERQQVGARVTRATYRQLKARAALAGVTVQTLVEQAIDEFLAKSSS